MYLVHLLWVLSPPESPSTKSWVLLTSWVKQLSVPATFRIVGTKFNDKYYSAHSRSPHLRRQNSDPGKFSRRLTSSLGFDLAMSSGV